VLLTSVPTLRLGVHNHEDKGSTIFRNALTITHPTTEHRIPKDSNIQQTAVRISNLTNKPYNLMKASQLFISNTQGYS